MQHPMSSTCSWSFGRNFIYWWQRGMGSIHHSTTTSQHWCPSTHQSCTSPSWSPTHKRITPSSTPRSESSITERKNLAIFSSFWNMWTIQNAWTSVSQWLLCSLALQKNFWNHVTASSMAEHRGIVEDGGNIDAGSGGNGDDGGRVLWGLRSKRALQTIYAWKKRRQNPSMECWSE